MAPEKILRGHRLTAYTALLQQHHPPNPHKFPTIHHQTVHIDAARHQTPLGILPIPGDPVVPDRLMRLHQRPHLLTQHVVDHQGHLPRFRELVGDLGFRIEGIGEVLPQGILGRQRTNLIEVCAQQPVDGACAICDKGLCNFDGVTLCELRYGFSSDLHPLYLIARRFHIGDG